VRLDAAARIASARNARARLFGNIVLLWKRSL
jgi:hypothetical protein